MNKRKSEAQGAASGPARSGDPTGLTPRTGPDNGTAPVPREAWRFAIQQCLKGTPVHLLNYIFGAAETDGRGEITRLYAFPADRETRLEIVQALLHIGRFSGRLKHQDLLTKEAIGTAKERVRDLEVGAAELLKLCGASRDDMGDLADSLGIDRESLERRIRDRRKKPKGRD